MRNIIVLTMFVIFASCNQKKPHKIEVSEFQDKMKGAWVGQMVGVGWGLPTEFKYIDSLIPEDKVPAWETDMVNQQGNDDLYVEMTFMRSMERYGLDVSIRQAGIDFANTGYTLWAANQQGRSNLRLGIAPPESGHPAFHKQTDDIDYQIEADFSGIIAPGMPNVPIQLGEKFGRLMNYGDGLYGGQFVGGMYAAAYFENDIKNVIKAGLACIPDESLYAQCIGDVLNWHAQYPDDWQKNWEMVMDKYFRNLEHQPLAQQNEESWVGIDAKINGAFIVMGLLYGEGDFEKTIAISMRCGLDSDCNPSNAAGILGTMLGFKKIPEKYKSGLDMNKKFSYSPYTMADVMNLSEKFAREFIERNGGTMANEGSAEVFIIPKQTPKPSPFIPSYNPSPADMDNKYSDDEMDQIWYYSDQHFKPLADSLGLEMQVLHCGKKVKPELVSWKNEQRVMKTIPANAERSTSIKIMNTTKGEGTLHLSFKAGHEPGEQWLLKVGKKEYLISEAISRNGWIEIEHQLDEKEKRNQEVDLTASMSDQQAVNYWSGFTFIYK